MTSSKSSKSAMVIALDCLSRRVFTHYELETRLKEKGIESSEIIEVLKRLEEWGYLNDQELALTFSQSRLKRFSRRRVQQDLKNRGLDPLLIEQALGSIYSSQDELQQCITLAQRWWIQENQRWERRAEVETKKGSTPRQLWLQQKVARKLVMRGYPSDMVRNALQKVQTLNDEQDEQDEP